MIMKPQNLPSYILAGTIVLGFFALLFTLVYYPIPEANRDMLNIVSGSLITSFSAVVSYHFGSTSSSKQKNELLAQSMPKPE